MARDQLPKGLIGVVHLQGLPGDPVPGRGGFAGVHEAALHDADALAEGGIRAVVIENFGSAPFPKGSEGDRLEPHVVAFMALMTLEMRKRFEHVGVNCLRNDARAAMGIACATGADFIRVNVHTGAYVTDQGVIEGEAAATLRYREALRSPVAVVADVLVKHAAPLAPLTATQATHEALDRGHASAVIVSGTGTGQPVDLDTLREVRAAASDRPVWIGSGFTPDDAPELVPHIDAAIVGTWLKEDGDVSNPVDAKRVRQLVGQCAELFG